VDRNQKEEFLLDLRQILAEVHKSMRQREMKEVKTNQQAPKNHKESHQLLQFVFYNNCLS
jgi:hypothetical protein